MTIEDDFDRRHLGSVSLRRLFQKEPKYLLLQLSLKMAELGKSSFHRSADRCQLNEQLRETIFLFKRMSERASGDPRMCEILVNKLERKDLGTWRF